MALSGTLLADFSAVGVEGQKAEAALAALTATSDKTGTALDAMVTRFNGTKVITDATLMADIFERAGGAAKFTTSELETLGRTGAEAAEKMRALGLDVPIGIQRIAAATKDAGDASAGAAPQVNTLHGAFSAVDGVLASMGIHIAPEVKALGELGDASGKTASDLGLIGVGGLAVGAAIGGWKIGRAVADFFDLDATIGNATAKLLGWGDVAAEVAGSKADVLAEASRRVGFEVLSLTTALEINATFQKDWRDNATISANVVQGWRAELEKVGPDLASLTADLASHNFTMKDLAERYHVSIDALQFFTRETKAASDAEKEHDATIQASNRSKLKALGDEMAANKETRAAEAKGLLETTKLWDEYFVLRQQHGGTANEIAMAQIDSWGANLTAKMSKAGTDTDEFYDGLAAVSSEKMAAIGVDWNVFKTKSIPALQELADNAWKTYNAMADSGQFFRVELDKQLAKYHQLQDEARGYGDAGVDAADRIREAQKRVNDELEKEKKTKAELAAINHAMGNTQDVATAAQDSEINALLKQGWSLKNAEAIKLARQWGFTPQLFDNLGNPETTPSKGERVPGYISGGPTGEGGLSMLHRQEYVVPEGGALVMRGEGASGVTFAPGSIVIQGSVIAERELTARLTENITRSVLRLQKV